MLLFAGLILIAVAALVVAAAIAFQAPGAHGDRRAFALLASRPAALALAAYWAAALLLAAAMPCLV
jgi:hypothetical protein